jgi:hypothetical protein
MREQLLTTHEQIRDRDIRQRGWHVCFGSKADIAKCPRHVRFTPESGHSSARVECPAKGMNGFSENSARPTRHRWTRDLPIA